MVSRKTPFWFIYLFVCRPKLSSDFSFMVLSFINKRHWGNWVAIFLDVLTLFIPFWRRVFRECPRSSSLLWLLEITDDPRRVVLSSSLVWDGYGRYLFAGSGWTYVAEGSRHWTSTLGPRNESEVRSRWTGRLSTDLGVTEVEILLSY